MGLLVVPACPSDSPGGDGGTTGGVVTGVDDGTTSGSGSADETGGGDGTGGTGPCVTNDDCALSPGLETCDPGTGECVGCLGDGDCLGALTCNEGQLCEGCDEGNQCPLGTTCSGNVCVPGCDSEQPCPNGFACCNGTCADLAGDPDTCGDCDTQCEAPANGTAGCNDGQCGVGACDDGFIDCNGIATDGCEGQGSCTCTAGEQQPCYTGDPATADVGVCQSGTQTCAADGASWSACTGEVTPGTELCANAADDDCDGVVDEDPDDDGDGFTLCAGNDCCDEQGPDCLNPELVNPGAFEVDGNTVDDDCDGIVDNPLPACDMGLASNSNNADDYARALDLCQFTAEVPASPADAVWGVIDTQLTLTSGAGAPAAGARSLRDGFGANVNTQFGDRLAVLSSGTAADNFDDANPGFVAFQDGDDNGLTAAFPADWYAANGNSLPNANGCPAPTGNVANDPVMLSLRLRVPTNANSFSMSLFFYSAEYPEYVCTEFNDFFVALVDSADPMVPPDKNIAIYDDGANTWPLGVNILSAAPGLFTECTDGTISQCGAGATPNYAGCTSVAGLVGTGFDQAGTTTYSCNYSGFYGGGTGWLTVSSPVVPGETIDLRLAIWDTADGLFDSVVLLDNFQWSVQGSAPGVAPS
jgi:hypothetical protein